jgi:predicted nucleic acid-binding protein
MVIYVFDASAILRYFDGEAGADRVEQIITEHLTGENRIVVSAVHWGEVAYIVCRKHGLQVSLDVLSRLMALGFEVVPASAERAVKSGLIKAQRKISYADAFGVDLAQDSPDHVLLTADLDVTPVKKDVRIEFLPLKLKRAR